MAEIESSGVAKAGLTTGIIGTSLAGLWALGGANGGLLGGLFGGNGAGSVAVSAALAEKDGKIAELSAERYADGIVANVYSATRQENRTLRDEMYAFITPLSNEAAENKTRVAVLEAQIKADNEKAVLREQLVRKDIAQLGTIVATQGALLNQITKQVIPAGAICPEVMQRYNSWVAPTTDDTTTTGTSS